MAAPTDLEPRLQKALTSVDAGTYVYKNLVDAGGIGDITQLTDNGGGTADGTVASQAAPTTLTDSTGLSGTHDDTLAASAAPVTLTDSTGDSGTHDDTLADGLTIGAALTDNSTGAAGDTIAAGVGIETHYFPVTLPVGGTTAVDQLTAFTPGYKFKILGWGYIEAVPTTGTNSSRVYNMEIGTTDVGTVASTTTITTASAAAGRVIAGTAVSGANTGTASDTISIEVAATGTTHDAGSGAFFVRIQNMDTADAVASMAAKINTIRTDITVQNQNDSDLAQKVIELVTLSGVLAQNDSDMAQKIIELVTLATTARDNLKELTTQVALIISTAGAA